MNNSQEGGTALVPPPSLRVPPVRHRERLIQAVRSEAGIAERSLRIPRADVAVQLALRVAPSTIPTDTKGAANRLVRLVFSVKREMPAA